MAGSIPAGAGQSAPAPGGGHELSCARDCERQGRCVREGGECGGVN